ncbi:amidohydrolase family protein [uncultured Parasphingorhabdus sp.]|uniref:amidohydrolase family protein n=1 Tax=uncultured Parasphingorhabdus sp. TaxID=2709694 RepID=UPI0030D8D811|tara:strand:- start:7926 stop:9392 length:1467 start_codon:yes stop_codon:yes gene_type:complete
MLFFVIILMEAFIVKFVPALAFFFSLVIAPTPLLAQADSPLLLHNVQILDLSGAEPALRPGQSILIDGGTIKTVGPMATLSPDHAVRLVDGGGRIAMPGLVDMHVHVWDEAALGAYLARGVTTVRNASGMPFHLRLAHNIEAGKVAGPRLITTGPILNGNGPNAQINHQIVSSGAEARAAVRAQHDAGYRRIKVYSNLSREAYDAVRDEARTLGMTVMGHTPEGIREPGMPRTRPFNIAFEELLDDGFITFEHIESIVWHGLRNQYDEAAAKRLATRIASAGVPVDPTLLAFYNLMRVAETRGEYLERPGVEILNPLVVAQEQENYDRWSGEAIAPARAAFEFYKRATKVFADAGVLLVSGSDAGIFTNIPGHSLIQELHLLSEAGLSHGDVLRAATRNAAFALGEADRAGRIAPGHRADLILLDGNPLDDLDVAGHPFMVIAGGRLYDQTMLDQLYEAASQVDVARTQRNLVEGLQAQGGDPSILAE